MNSMSSMRAWVITEYGGPEVLEERRLPIPEAAPGAVVVRVRAIGVNHAEAYMRKGAWGEVARVTGIECAGEVHADGDHKLAAGTKVVAIVGGLGRTLDGTYAEYVRVPSTNVAAVDTSLPWEALAAVPEVFATAWVCLDRELGVARGASILVRGGTSALGQAAIDVARERGLEVLATTRSPERLALLRALGAEPILETGRLAGAIREARPQGVDAVLELVGTSTLVDSLACAKMGSGRVCFAGFLGGLDPLPGFQPLLHMPSGVRLSFFASAFELGTASAPLAGVPLQAIVDRVQAGSYRARVARVLPFEGMVEAHRLMESSGAGGKIVVLGSQR